MEETNKVNPIAEEGTQDGRLGIWVRYTYDDKIRNEKMRGSISGVFSEYPEKFGKGEWVAKTIEDAKQMAIDFNRRIRSIVPNGYGLAKVGISSTNVQPLHKSQLELQMFNKPLMPCFCKALVTGRCG